MWEEGRQQHFIYKKKITNRVSKELSIEQKREILKRIAKGDVRPEHFSTGEISTELWVIDESDPEFMRITYPDNDKRMRKEDYDRRAVLLKQTRITIVIV